jgi:hypothetical protein
VVQSTSQARRCVCVCVLRACVCACMLTSARVTNEEEDTCQPIVLGVKYFSTFNETLEHFQDI